MLTDHLNHSADGREWGRHMKQLATGLDEDDDDGHIDCYTSPNVAALLNAQNERFRSPRLWEATVDRDVTHGEAIVACREVTTTAQVPIPTLTGMHHARFAVLCARGLRGPAGRRHGVRPLGQRLAQRPGRFGDRRPRDGRPSSKRRQSAAQLPAKPRR